MPQRKRRASSALGLIGQQTVERCGPDRQDVGVDEHEVVVRFEFEQLFEHHAMQQDLVGASLVVVDPRAHRPGFGDQDRSLGGRAAVGDESIPTVGVFEQRSEEREEFGDRVPHEDDVHEVLHRVGGEYWPLPWLDRPPAQPYRTACWCAQAAQVNDAARARPRVRNSCRTVVEPAT